MIHFITQRYNFISLFSHLTPTRAPSDISFSWCNIQNFSHKKSKSICIGRFSWCLWNAKDFLLILEVPEMRSISFVYFPGKAIEKITQVKFSKAHGVQAKMKIDCEALRIDEAESQKIWNVNSDRISKQEFFIFRIFIYKRVVCVGSMKRWIRCQRKLINRCCWTCDKFRCWNVMKKKFEHKSEGNMRAFSERIKNKNDCDCDWGEKVK